jgi:serine/threonine protein kinase
MHFLGNSCEDIFTNIAHSHLPDMPTKYSTELIAILKSMLNRNPLERPNCQEMLDAEII